MKLVREILLMAFIGLMVGGGQSARAQIFTPTDDKAMEPTILIDAAAFRLPEGDKVRLELYYQVYNFGLQFKEIGGNWVAEYEVTAVLLDDDEHQVSAQERSKEIRLVSGERTRSKFDYRTSQINFEVRPGTYHLRVSLRDKANDAVSTRTAKIKIDKFDSKQPMLSGIEFVQATNSESDSSVFSKGSLVIIPSVSRAFGGDRDTRLAYYFEIYRGREEAEKVVIETIIRHQMRGMLYRDTLHVSFDGPVVRQLREVDINEYVPGTYELEVTLRGRRNKELDRARQEFAVMWTQEGLLRHDWKTAIDQISVIAEPGELDDIKKLDDYEERRQAFDAFWQSKDPTVGTPVNEVKQEFYRRINVANQNFGYMRREGWRTDRGRVLVLHGEPDQIDDMPYSHSDLPYQIWHYYRDGRYRRFTFVDENQDGDYRLQFPYDGLNQRPDF